MIQWAESEVVVPTGPYEGYQYKVDRLPYARLLLNELGKWPVHVITGPTQSGKSLHAFVLVIMYYLFEREENVIVGIPDANMAGDKWSEDIKPVIEKSSYAHLLPTTGAGSKGGGKIVKVTFGNGRHIRFMSAGGDDKQRSAATSRILVVTESDGMDRVSETSQEGQTKIQQLQGRVRSFAEDSLQFFECTVSAEENFTWKNYQAGTASRIVHQCRSCDEWVSPEREHLVGWQEAKSVKEAGRLGSFVCPECGIHFTEQDRVEMNQSARLMHKGQEATKEDGITGEPVETNVFGFRWSAFQNLLISTSKLCEEEWEAAHDENSAEVDIARNQQAWANPASNPNVEKIPINQSIVRGSHSKYAGRCNGMDQGQVPENSTRLTSFIDCSKRVLQWSVESKYGRNIHVVDYGFFETSQPDVVGEEVAVTDALKILAPRLAARYSLDCGLIDVGHWRESILNVFPELGMPWFPSHGVSSETGYKHPSSTANGKELPSDGNRHWHWSKDEPTNQWVVNFDPDTLKHRVHGGFLIRPLTDEGLQPGAITLFGVSPSGHAEFARQVTAEEFVRRQEPRKKLKVGWEKIRTDNHMLDDCVGNMAARMVCQHWGHLEALEAEARRVNEANQSITSPDGRPFFAGNR